MDAEAFRREAHKLADWIADYLADPGRYPVLSQVRPGDIRGALPGAAPEHGEPFDAIFADFERVILPGITHWNHPGFFAYFAITAQRARRPRRIPLGGAQRPGDALAHVAVSDRARGGGARLAATAAGAARIVRGRDLRHRVDLHASRARRGARSSVSAACGRSASQADPICRRFASTVPSTRTRPSTRR